MIEISNKSCGCQTAPADKDAAAIEILEAIRADCPVLQLFLPDNIWPDFKEWHAKRDIMAEHQSILLSALKRGYLAGLTGPIHRYLIENETLRQGVRSGYVGAMQERWMFYSDPLERHRKYRMFTGLIAELQFAEWLETTQWWTIVGLEAISGRSDIEARPAVGAVTAFEVKFIGTQDHDFEMLLDSMAQGVSVSWGAPNDAINYLLFRVYEAAKQLARIDGCRIAVMIINEDTWGNFDFQLKNGWIEWSNPSFFDISPSWESFLNNQEKHYPEIRTELPSVIRSIDAVWIMKRSRIGYKYHRAYVLPTGRS